MNDSQETIYVSTSEPIKLKHLLGRPEALDEYISKNPEMAYLELYEAFSMFVVRSINFRSYDVAFSAIKRYVGDNYSNEDSTKAISELSARRDQVEKVSKLLGGH